MLVSAGEVGVREVDVAELACEHRVGAHQVDLARPDVAGVERDLAEADEVLGEVAAPVPPDTEECSSLAPWHVLDRDGDALLPGPAQWSGVPALVHHDLHAVVAGLGGPGIDPLEPERVERTGAEDDADGHQRPRRISTNC